MWNLNSIIHEEIKKDHEKDYDEEISKFTNKLIKQITDNLENFSYNKIIANLHEIYSFLIKKIQNHYSKQTLIENYQKILIIMSPVIPHFSNECLSMINVNKNVNWPSYDKKILVENEIEIVIQINGKKRGLLKVKRDIVEKDLLQVIFEDKKLNKYLASNEIKRKIFIKNKLINIII